jgi:glycosyltransferase involved in cell wall biosynthesis
MFIPDARVGWVRPSVKFLSKWLTENKVDAVITTGPPHSMHLIGRGLKQKFPEIKWVADFRDPWSDMDYLSEFAMGSRAKAKILNQEQSVVNLADHIIVTSIGAGVKLTGDANSSKVSWIPNGWDPSDFPQSKPQTDDIFRIGHFGALHGARNSTALWSAVSQYNKISEKQIQLVFAGHVCEEVKEDLKRFNLHFSCSFLGNLPHKEAVEEMMKCSALLLIHNDTESATRSIPGKLFEYLATGVPVVSICRSNGDLSDLLDEYGLPHSEHDDDMAAVAQLSGTLTQKSIDTHSFKREELTNALIKELEELTQ